MAKTTKLDAIAAAAARHSPVQAASVGVAVSPPVPVGSPRGRLQKQHPPAVNTKNDNPPAPDCTSTLIQPIADPAPKNIENPKSETEHLLTPPNGDRLRASIAHIQPIGTAPLADPVIKPIGTAPLADPIILPLGTAPGAPPSPITPPPATTLAKTPTNDFTAFLLRYRADPVGFVRNVLKAEPDEWQIEFLEAIAKGERRISVRAGHGVGKSTACAWASIWHLLTRFPQKCVMTAPTAGQLFDALFSEIKHWIKELPPYLSSLIEVFSDRIVLRAAPESSFISARTSSADKPEALAGIHSEHVLLICDEASAIPEPVYESAAGSMSGHSATTVLIGNPTRNSGLFFQTHHRLKRPDSVALGDPSKAPEGWKTLHVNSVGNPRVAQDFVEQIKATYGEESNAFRVRVLGEFALRDDDVLIPAELVDAAMLREIAPSDREPMVYGLDVARFGNDRSVLCKRRGNAVLGFKTWQNLDLMALVGAVINEASQDGTIAELLIDSIGVGGGVADRLREVQSAVPNLRTCAVRDVNVSEAAALNPGANRLRDDLWMSARDWLRARACSLPKDDDLRQELVSPTYKFTSTGKLQVEAKDMMKKRGLRSPDMADALCLTFASIACSIGGRSPKWIPGQSLKRNLKGLVGLRI